MSALFAELQKGEGITQGLRKVTDDMKTKNRTDRSGLVTVADHAQKEAASKASAPAAKPVGPPRCEFDPNRKMWVVENQVGNRELVLKDVQPTQPVYIYNCKDSVVQIPTKANAVSVDSCTKTGVVFFDLIAACEVINCRNVQLQCTGMVPTVAIEKTDGAQVYLPKKVSQNEDFQLVTAKCSEVNVVVVPEEGNEADEPVEHPVPEQFISSFKGGKMVTTAAAHSGA